MGHEKRSVSIVFRALNEEKWFADALQACRDQDLSGSDIETEIILVDSGSTDGTLEIAERFGCRIVHIKKQDFTFGRSLNWGCEAATGEVLVFISAHCIPAHPRWLVNLTEPLLADKADYTYGKQVGHEVSRFSEKQIFAKYFTEHDKPDQGDFFVNNANSAIRTSVWERYRFCEKATGLEDMVLGKALKADGGRIAYIADAPVVHIHEETLKQTRRRYYREALTLREIMPEVQVTFRDFCRYFTAAVFHDWGEALKERCFASVAGEILLFRFNQFWGTYKGHNEHRTLSRTQKEAYYYPASHKRNEKAHRSLIGEAAETS
ncbi:glycosyltransferase [Parvularcula maris]|uniref:Glycosyltransferase family 2 protein n=1 Tax=Parvularcula maris TaxID=2965077 RepID=A0A9X2L995_9PROT|nr:glycosyltransferase family 2 protein [Parvularcula maris]MCQ8185382.1 glycosyltransferase family 2 protein [Parvularcula maris]